MSLIILKYSFHAQVRLVCRVSKDLFSRMKLVKALLHTQLKQANLENQLHISTESRKIYVNDTVFQHFVDDLKQCKLDIQTDLQLVPVILSFYSIHLVAVIFNDRSS